MKEKQLKRMYRSNGINDRLRRWRTVNDSPPPHIRYGTDMRKDAMLIMLGGKDNTYTYQK